MQSKAAARLGRVVALHAAGALPAKQVRLGGAGGNVRQAGPREVQRALGAQLGAQRRPLHVKVPAQQRARPRPCGGAPVRRGGPPRGRGGPWGC